MTDPRHLFLSETPTLKLVQLARLVKESAHLPKLWGHPWFCDCTVAEARVSVSEIWTELEYRATKNDLEALRCVRRHRAVDNNRHHG